jgi:hypothetical protein
VRGRVKNVFPTIFVHLKSYLLCDLKPPAKFHNPMKSTSGRKVTWHKERKKERKKEKNAVNSGHLVL